MRNMIILDLETKPNLALKGLWMATHEKEMKESIDASATEQQVHDYVHGKMATDTDFCEIALICIKQLGGETRVIKDFSKLGDPAWGRLLQQMDLCTYNGKSFDLPIIIKHGVKLGLDLPYRRLANACKKWGYGERHVDIMETLAFGGRFASLDTYLQIYLGKEKESKGAEFFRTATLEELEAHCVADCLLTEELYLKFEKIL